MLSSTTTSVLCCVAVLASLAAASYPLPNAFTPEATPFPRPQSFSNGTLFLGVSPSLAITTACPAGVLTRATARFAQLILTQSVPSPVMSALLPPVVANITSVVVDVASCDETLDETTDESYTLNVTSAGDVVVSAATVFGALHGLDAFAQLVETSPVYQNPAATMLVVRGAPWHIADAPRFHHRGVLIDTSRHFLPLTAVRLMIDGLAANRLNVLHWHLIDAESFPFVSEALPLLNKGAYSSGETYTAAELTDTVAYAKDRGVRVMLELDTPGHTAAFRFGYPDVVASCPSLLNAYGPENLALDPSNPDTYTLLHTLFQELGQIFPDSFLHLGGDEVNYNCWAESPRIVQFMKTMGFGDDYSKLQQYYINQLLNLTTALFPTRSLVIYQDTFDNGVKLPSNVVLDAWKSDDPMNILDELAAIVRAGYRAILANGPNGEWYLNDGFGNGDTYMLWTVVYGVEPTAGSKPLTPAEEKFVLGGEVSLWGEEINANNVFQKAFPRASAFAERMWSAKTVNSVTEVAPRLARHICRMFARELPSAPIAPGSCFPRQSY